MFFRLYNTETHKSQNYTFLENTYYTNEIYLVGHP